MKKLKSLIILFMVTVNLIQADGLQENKVRSVDLYKLMSRLDLDRPELETVRRSYGNPSITAVQLINYFKSRTSVKHPAGKLLASEMRGKAATEDEINMADNAMKHIFTGQSAYPPVFCGDDIDWGMRPVPDNEWVWQLNRMYFWDAMAKTYLHTGGERYAGEIGRAHV